MPSRLPVSHILIVALFGSLQPPIYGQRPMPPQSLESAKAQSQTIVEMRNVGTALFSWLDDQINDDNNPQLEAPQVENYACTSPRPDEKFDGPCKMAYIDRLPLISHQELTALLVPRYIAGIPEKDGWGRPYEFRLDRKNLLNRSVMAIRSFGSDGAFSGTLYGYAAYLPFEADQDLVWMDGFFIRHPQREDTKRPE